MPKRKAPSCVQSDHVVDYLHKEYLYDEKHDELFVYIYIDSKRRKISLGECKDMLEEDLEDLIIEYNAAIDEYKKAQENVSELFNEKNDIEDNIDERRSFGENRYDNYHMNSAWCNVMDDIYKVALPYRNECANDVAKLYFVISKK